MVAYAAFLLMAWCTCLQHAGAFQIAYDPSEGEDGGQVRGELLGALAERPIGRQKRGGKKRDRSPSPVSPVSPPTTQPPTTQPPTCDLEWIGDELPIILYEGNHEIVSPKTTNGKKIISIADGRGVLISCERRGFTESALPPRVTIVPRAAYSISAFRAYCESTSTSSNLVVYNKRLDNLSKITQPPSRGTGVNRILDTNRMNDISCKTKVEHTLIATPETCDGGSEYHIISFDKTKKEFFKQITACFDKSKETTLWTQHILHGMKLGNAENGKPNDNWRDYLTKSEMEDLYEESLTIVQKILGKTVNAPQKVIAKGHLSPDADYVTLAQRSATYHYINALPQWQAVNNGNWKNIVEVSVRNLAKKLQTDLIIITGGHGILKLINKENIGDYISLKAAPKVPLPELTWKVVYDPITKKGVAFVTSNDPFIGQPLSPTTEVGTKAYPEATPPTAPLKLLCTSVCGQLDMSWFKLNALIPSKTVKLDNYEQGYTYCCRVDDLKKKISTIPSEYANVHSILGEKAGKGK